MKISERSIILIHEHGDTIIVDDYLEGLLRGKIQPILWYRDGLFRIIPTSILQNIIGSMDIFIKAGRKGTYINKIHWNQGWEINHKVGCALSGSGD